MSSWMFGSGSKEALNVSAEMSPVFVFFFSISSCVNVQM